MKKLREAELRCGMWWAGEAERTVVRSLEKLNLKKLKLLKKLKKLKREKLNLK